MSGLIKHHHSLRPNLFKRGDVAHFEDEKSILALYSQVEIELHKCSSFSSAHPLCEQFPMKDVIKEAVARYGQKRTMAMAYSPLFPSHGEHEHTLAVHVRLGDRNEFDHTFVASLEQMLLQNPGLKSVVIHTSADADHHGSEIKSPWELACGLEASWKSLQKRLGDGKVHYLVPQHPDDDLYLLSRAKHLLVHAGVYSALLAIASTGNVYIPARLVTDYYSLDLVRMLPSNTFMLALNGTVYPISTYLKAHGV
eukprot:gene37303-45289_t